MARRGGVSVAATYALVQNLRGDCSFEFDIESQGASEGSLEAIMAALRPDLFVMSSEEGQAGTDKLWAPEVSFLHDLFRPGSKLPSSTDRRENQNDVHSPNDSIDPLLVMTM